MSAQRWFDRGLAWTYGYNHDEAVFCFREAARADPDCCMAQWGIAYAAGPNYNKDWHEFDQADLVRSVEVTHAAALEAKRLATHATSLERALIDALQARYPQGRTTQDFSAWTNAYADAMRAVYASFTDNPDVCTLFAEALINRTPWNLWDLRSGLPTQGAATLEAVNVLEQAIAAVRARGEAPHAGLLHIYIHTMEMSAHPERALQAAEDIRGLVPDAGHLQHMGTHIDVLCGRYREVVEWNTAAIVADRKHLEHRGALNFYSTYRSHNYHFKAYGAMLMGRYADALDAADELAETLPEELLRIESPPMADWAEAYWPVRTHVLIRFGKWHELIAARLPEDPQLYAATTALMLYGKGIAHAALGNVDEACAARALFRDASAAVPESRRLFNNSCRDLIQIAAAMLDGEIAYRKGEYDDAFAYLRKATALDDALPYDEPWGWMQPTRHALGALLLEQDHLREAEAVFRADLGFDRTLPRACQHQDNVWGLHGFHESLVRQGKRQEAADIKPRLDQAVALADVPVTVSCFCRLTHFDTSGHA